MSEQAAILKVSEQAPILKRYGLVLALAALVVLLLIPSPEGLPVAGHRMLALLFFGNFVDDGGSFLPGKRRNYRLPHDFSPGRVTPRGKSGNHLRDHAGPVDGVGRILEYCMGTVGAALFLSAAMMKTGLDRRIALKILSVIGASANRILIGVILTGFVLSFFVPSTTARVACVVPIVAGIIAAFGVDIRSRFVAFLAPT